MASSPQSTPESTLDVARFLEARGMTRFHYYLLIISCCVTFFDGLDFSLISFTLPYLRDEMALTDEMTGYVSSAAFAGQMIGSLVGSYIADIIGRRPVIIWCTLLSAVLTFVTGYADGPYQLIALRLLGGLAIGGLLAPGVVDQYRKHARRHQGARGDDHHARLQPGRCGGGAGDQFHRPGIWLARGVLRLRRGNRACWR